MNDNLYSLVMRLAATARDYEKIMHPKVVDAAILLHAGAAVLREVPEEDLEAALEEARDLLLRGRNFGQQVTQGVPDDE